MSLTGVRSLLSATHSNLPQHTFIPSLITPDHECIVPLIASSLQSSLFWVVLTYSVDVTWSSRTVFSQVMIGRPSGLFQFPVGMQLRPSRDQHIIYSCPNRLMLCLYCQSEESWFSQSQLFRIWNELMPFHAKQSSQALLVEGINLTGINLIHIIINKFILTVKFWRKMITFNGSSTIRQSWMETSFLWWSVAYVRLAAIKLSLNNPIIQGKCSLEPKLQRGAESQTTPTYLLWSWLRPTPCQVALRFVQLCAHKSPILSTKKPLNYH